MTTPPAYTTQSSLPYSPHTPLNTLTLHTPTATPQHPPYSLLYIHGGAFRDPLVTSASLAPSLPLLFKNPHIASIASVNYRLSPHSHHPTHPSLPDDKSRNVKWPVHIDDVRDAVGWLKREKGWEGKEWVIVGHSVGGTMALMLGMELAEGGGEGRWGDEKEGGREGLKGVVCIEGIYDFVALRDAHMGFEGMYEDFTNGAFGEGRWEDGNLVECGRKVKGEVQVVAVVHSRGDELVEWGQAERMVEVLGREERDGVGVLMEVEGRHQEVVEGGRVIGEVVERVVGMLIAKGEGGI